MTDSLFTRRGRHWLPTGASRGPWGETLHGGAPAALLMHALEADLDGPQCLARLTIDLCRPVPMAPLEVAVERIRMGRQVQVRSAILTASGTLLARATALHTAAATRLPAAGGSACPLPQRDTLPASTLAGAASEATGQPLAGDDGLHYRLLAWRHAGIAGTGTGSAWLQMPLPLAPDLPMTPTVHLACLADFANGTAQRRTALRDGGGMAGCINADINLHVLRVPAPGPVAMVAGSQVDGPAGLVTATCWDAAGEVARISQATLPMPVG